MTLSHRLFAALVCVSVLTANQAWCASPKAGAPGYSNLDRDLFYELLVGELSARSGDSATGYALMLDAARKSNSPQVYQRAVELALGARSGVAALEAARAWSNAFPASADANRHLMHILIGLNRVSEIQEPIKRYLSQLPQPERMAALSTLPRLFARVADKKQLTQSVEIALAAELGNPATGPTAWSTLGLLHLQGGNSELALDAARRGLALNPQAEEPIYLALSAMNPKAPGAEAMVLKYLSGVATPEIRMTYVRQLLEAQRSADAYTQLQIMTRDAPTFADGWLVQGSLEFQNQQMARAEASLNAFIALNPAATAAPAPQELARGVVQAYLLLAQIAEQTRRFELAQTYLNQIDNPKDALRVATRRASILARQGKLDEARATIQRVPETQSDEARGKINAEVNLLRDNKQYLTAYQLLTAAIERYPQDHDLLYEQAMVAERLGKTDEMEQLLKRLIVAKPDNHHAYNALGFSLADRNVRLDEAYQLIVKALELAPNDPFIVDSLAWVEFRRGKKEDALRLLRSAFQTRPDAEIAAHLGEVLWTLGQRDEALALWKRAAEINPDNETLLETTKRLQQGK
ncbi:MAG: tetratricopeptide repeat protein [Rhodoferax sp.]|nr:tetratricopeptide repeat protein [Rhodoferax sp.]MCF8208842.1 tetratricopeptide repeat protein [Rhodoferax sp.]